MGESQPHIRHHSAGFVSCCHARTWWSVKREPVEAQNTHRSMGCSLNQYVINETLTGSSRAA